MYAKLVFSDYNYASAMVRDVVRLLTDSASGSASLSNLEFINQDLSTLTAGVNSGWTLKSGQTFKTSGTALGAGDNEWILESTCVDTSKKKTVRVGINGGTNEWNQPESTLCVTAIADVDGTYQKTAAFYNGTNTTYMQYFGIGSMGTSTVHIWATPRKLIIAGYNGYEGQNRMMGVVEFPETGMTTYYSKVPMYWFCQGDGTTQNTSTSEWYESAGTGAMGANTNNHYGQFIDAFVNQTDGSNIRALHIVPDIDYGAGSNTRVWYENNSLYGTYSTTSALHYQFYYCPNHLNGYNKGFVLTNRLNKANGARVGETLNSSGDKTLYFEPIKFDLTFSGAGMIDLTSLSNWYNIANIGTTFDTITVGSDVYTLFTSAFQYGGSQLIKVE